MTCSVAVGKGQQGIWGVRVGFGPEVGLVEPMAHHDVDPRPIRPLDVEGRSLVLDRGDRCRLAEPPLLAVAAGPADGTNSVMGRDAIRPRDAVDPEARGGSLRLLDALGV